MQNINKLHKEETPDLLLLLLLLPRHYLNCVPFG